MSYEHSSTVGQNLIVSQSPSAGALAHRTQQLPDGSKVALTVSKGKRN